MKEILFRGKRIDTGEWVEGFYMGASDFLDVHEICTMEGCGTRHEVDPSTIGQYTGFVDKNGVKIFEGDICKDSLGWVFEVLWDEDNARFIGRHSKPRGDTYICYVGRKPPVEVIGNIHDKEDTAAQA